MLKIDAELTKQWQEMLDKLAPYQQSYWERCKDAPTRWINRIREYNPDGGFALDLQ